METEKQITATCGDFSFPLVIARNPKAKRMRIRIDRRRKTPVLVLGSRMSEKNGLQFVMQNAAWIKIRLENLPEERKFDDMMTFDLFGESVTIRQSPTAKRGVWLDGGVLWVSGQPEHLPRRVLDFIKGELRRRMRQKARELAEILNVKIGAVTVRDTKSRWGSCNKNGDLSFSWRLALAPAPVCDYVAAHEVSHIREMNHSLKFWKTVALLDPDFKTHEQWLKKNADFLHSFSV